MLSDSESLLNFDLPGSLSQAMPTEEIWRALAGDQLLPWFQPIVDIASRKVLGVEALARWQHPAQGILLPLSFVPAMEERGMIRELTELILEKSLYACRDWQDAGCELDIYINLSPLALSDEELAARLSQRMQILGLPPARLTLEFAAASLRSHWTEAAAQLPRLREAGFGVVADEFGVGLELNEQLGITRFSAIKLDRAFVQGVSRNHHLRAIIGENLALAREAGLQSIAIGVEDANDLATLSELGCQAVQGHICASAMPATQLSAWIAGWENA